MRLHRVHPPWLRAEDGLLQVGREGREGFGGAGGAVLDRAASVPPSSPHLVQVRERIRINGQPISRELFSKYFWLVYNRLEETKVGAVGLQWGGSLPLGPPQGCEPDGLSHPLRAALPSRTPCTPACRRISASSPSWPSTSSCRRRYMVVTSSSWWGHQGGGGLGKAGTYGVQPPAGASVRLSRLCQEAGPSVSGGCVWAQVWRGSDRDSVPPAAGHMLLVAL